MDTTLLIYSGILGFVVLAILRRPAVALGAFMCTYGLEQWAQSKSEFFYNNMALTNYVTTAVLLWALVIRQLKGVEARLVVPPVGLAVLALFGWSLVTALWSIAPGRGLGVWSEKLPYLLATVGLMPLVVAGLRDLRAGLLMAATLGTALLLLLLIDTDWSGRQIVLAGQAGSIRSSKGNPLAVASLAGWVSVIALLANFRGVGRVWGLARYAVVVLGLVVAIKTGSRGQLFALVTAGLVLIPFARRIKNVPGFVGTALAAVVLLVAATAVFDVLVGDGSTRWNFTEMQSTWTGSRLGMSGELLAAWYDAGPAAWLFGLGTSASFDPQILGGYPHVVMLEVLGELGIIGFLLLWAVPVLGFMAFWELHKLVRHDDEARGSAAVLGGLFLFEVILSFKQGSMLGSPFAFGFAVLLGRVAMLTRQRAERGALAEDLDTPPPGEAGRAGAFAAMPYVEYAPAEAPRPALPMLPGPSPERDRVPVTGF